MTLVTRSPAGTGRILRCQRPTMRWCLVLLVILGVLLAGLAKVATRQRGGSALRPSTAEPPATGGEDEEDVRDETPPSPPPAPRRRSPRRLVTVETNAAVHAGIAILHGHVRLPAPRSPGRHAGADDADRDREAIDLGDIAVIARDGARTLSARADGEGRFAFHLPPGAYTLSASAGPWTAVRTNVSARSGFDREVDLELALGATIGGRVRGATDGLAWVSVRPAGAPAPTPPIAQVSIDDDERFVVRGLNPEQRYDLTVSGQEIRSVNLPGVMAPAAELDVTVERRAILRGAIGVPAGEPCPIEEVFLRTAERDATTASASEIDVAAEPESGDVPDGACVFELRVPDGVSHATVIATGSGWQLEEAVEIPASGDPAPVCLNPPCGNPGDLAADVVVEISGAGEVRGLVVCLTETEPRLGETCLRQGTGPYVFKRRPLGSTMIVRAEGRTCVSDQRTITVQRGDNRIGIACARAAGAGHES